MVSKSGKNLFWEGWCYFSLLKCSILNSHKRSGDSPSLCSFPRKVDSLIIATGKGKCMYGEVEFLITLHAYTSYLMKVISYSSCLFHA